MSTIALNWELGADLGHIRRFLSIAKNLRERGHRPVCILRDIARAEEVFGGSGIEYLQAPVWLPKSEGLPPDLNFTETLMRFGFLHPEGLTAMVKSWRQLWKMLDAELLLLDMAPTACLAARGFGLPRILFGNSYAIPPGHSPLPPFRWWQRTAGEISRLNDSEQRVLRNINASAMRNGIPPLSVVGDLFMAEHRLIAAFPELDVYGVRNDGHYIGPINSIDMGAPPVWPPGLQPKVFAYVKHQYKHFDALMHAMQQTEARFLVFSPGISEANTRKYSSQKILFSTTPLRMDEVVPNCSLVVCHAGGTTDIALQGGKPVLQLPMQMEQTMTSRRTETLGAGLYLPLDGNPGELRRLLKRLLTESDFTNSANEFSQRYLANENQQNILNLTDICEKCLKTSN